MLPIMSRIRHQNQLIVKVWEKAVQKLSNPPREESGQIIYLDREKSNTSIPMCNLEK